MSASSGSGGSTTYWCEPCQTQLSNKGFYDIHIGSKTHKRTLRKKGISKVAVGKISHDKVQTPRLSYMRPSMSMDIHFRHFVLKEDQQFHREKYKTRSITSEDDYFNNLLLYIYHITSYLSIKLALDENVKQAKISINDKKWQSFGDIVVYVAYSNREMTYAIKCKQVTSSKHQIDSLKEAKVEIHKEYSSVCKLIERLIPQLDKVTMNKHFTSIYNAIEYLTGVTQFAIFTPCGAGSNFSRSFDPTVENMKSMWGSIMEINKHGKPIETKLDYIAQKIKTADLNRETGLVIRTAKRNEIINTNPDRETIFNFQTQMYEKSVVMPNISIYTNQNVYQNSITDLVKKKFSKYSYPDITECYRRYIEDWSTGKLGGNYKITKKDIILKIGEILLSKYVVGPRMVKLNTTNDSFDTWNSVIDKVDLTIVDDEQFIISKICQPINKLIEDIFSVKIDTSMRTIKLAKEFIQEKDDVVKKFIKLEKTIEEMKDKEMKAYLFEEVHDFLDVPLSKIYMALWKAGKIPLLMSSKRYEDDKPFILEVISFMKSHGVNKKFLLKTAQPEMVKSQDGLIIFKNLHNIQCFVDLETISIRVADSFILPLGEIQVTDQFFFKWVTPNTFLDLTLGRYSIKRNIFKNDIENELKIVLSDDMLEKIKETLYKRNRSAIKSDTLDRLEGLDPLWFG
ncbi:unnamed protein product [Acanthoscelides obtectus]|nr:unnamed protein product [Acanthoscelides obtectus]CAK1666920.1 hypothetical protein AOBTE_LOCUS25554 [Acanthoscelides obtectus]